MYWTPYVTVAQRRAKSDKLIKQMAKKGVILQPVTTEGRSIAHTFWGKSWCKHMDSYADFSNRLSRGKTYVRNGSVIDLVINTGSVKALVQGSSLYSVEVSIKSLSTEKWENVKKNCAGGVTSAIELLKGKISAAVMTEITHPTQGLFPNGREISFACDCPDGAVMCKHIAATLYGVGARLDLEPELLFKLRGVNHADLVSKVDTRVTPGKSKVVKNANLEQLFGIDLDDNSNDNPTENTAKIIVKREKPSATASALAKRTKRGVKVRTT